VPHEDAVYDRVGNIMLSRLMGADVRLVDDGFDIGIRDSWKNAIAEVEDAGGKPYPIPAGASVHKFGGLGYVGFAEEVAGAGGGTRLQVRLCRRLHGHRLDPCEACSSASPPMTARTG
jgi:1-aminocyclopropane-1-carboxylate deaminase/D-cysteine desulfhydrase-like pyridoxal-dependent ACC family enzyme